ncbi:MAG TPA: FeoA family protein [Balneolales bacterium]|nr:FeoA family protein [Balneolales bacterium]
MYPLSTTIKGEEVHIECLGCGSDEACRLRELGCVEGVSGKILSKHHNVILQVGETRIAIGGDLAGSIIVTPCIPV